jgi:hypothetical protein
MQSRANAPLSHKAVGRTLSDYQLPDALAAMLATTLVNLSSLLTRKHCRRLRPHVVADIAEDNHQDVVILPALSQLVWHHCHQGNSSQMQEQYQKPSTRFGLLQLARLALSCSSMSPSRPSILKHQCFP